MKTRESDIHIACEVDMLRDYPGTPQHQALLRAIVSYYEDDPRVLAISIFGSLVRGTWHRYSDLDLDVVTADGITIDPYRELTALCGSLAAIYEHAALIVPDGAEACDVVLESLLEFSIRYHPLQTTSPNIVDSLRVLAGRIDQATILAAGQANGRMRVSRQPNHILDQCIRYVVGADVALQRRQLWGAIELLHRARGLLMELFARTRDQARAYQVFESQADASLQTRLGATLPQYDLRSAQASLARLLVILEHDVEALSNGQIQIDESQRKILNGVRMRQAGLVSEYASTSSCSYVAPRTGLGARGGRRGCLPLTMLEQWICPPLDSAAAL